MTCKYNIMKRNIYYSLHHGFHEQDVFTIAERHLLDVFRILCLNISIIEVMSKWSTLQWTSVTIPCKSAKWKTLISLMGRPSLWLTCRRNVCQHWPIYITHRVALQGKNFRSSQKKKSKEEIHRTTVTRWSSDTSLSLGEICLSVKLRTQSIPQWSHLSHCEVCLSVKSIFQWNSDDLFSLDIRLSYHCQHNEELNTLSQTLCHSR